MALTYGEFLAVQVIVITVVCDSVVDGGPAQDPSGPCGCFLCDLPSEMLQASSGLTFCSLVFVVTLVLAYSNSRIRRFPDFAK